ncbi:MFS transporter [Blastococcus sp. MG754426]|uniref:MFS transporter n=1 Tax=unclassified Blastococcus TaxID=2619396 RepID=UPI001EEFD24F|nr:MULTISPECIES: MFS transporter [unclassified Blastococcus]MCF6508383.1 MFS transporter [Blastococcus sp. MG754426]MCF6512999.1 MFS transporter [Blastococcus sp. MG754427]MCF6735753.1 MFS transporter [Blastococcus sp. KM273129]
MPNPYLQVLRTPHALPMVLAAFIGRLPLSMVGLGSVLLVASETGSYGLGGAVAATGAVTTAAAGPLLGRWADTHGQRRVLLPVLAVFVLSGVVFLFSVREDWPLLVVFLSAGLAGACIPPVSSMIRVRWTHLLRGSHRLHTALSMESVVDEFVFIVGPVLVTFLSTTGHATSGVVTAFTLAAVGSLLFAAQRRTEPEPHGHLSRQGPSAIRTHGLRVLFVVGAAVGAILGTLEIALVAFADERDAMALSGVLIASLAVGSMASGIGWGAIHWRLPLRLRLVGALVLLTALVVPLLFIDGVWLMVPFVVVAGIAVSPSLISSFTLAELLVPRSAVTEAFTWIGTALGLGVAVGASVAGKIVDVAGANRAFVVAIVAAGIAAVVVGSYQRLLHVPAEHAAEPALAR